MTDEEAMEELPNSDGYSFPTWTLTLGLPTYEMRDVMSLIASDKRPIPDDAAFISGYLHMDGAVVESSVKELLDRRLVYRRGSYLMHWANRENFEERKEAYMEEKRLCARPVIELTTMREYADVHDALKFGSRYVDWKKIVAICDAKGEPTSETTRWRGERWFWKDDWNKNIKLKSGERIKDMQPVICYERGRCDYSVLELTRWYGFDHKSLLNSGKKGIVFDGLTWRLLRYDVDFEKRLKETPLICRETGKTFDTLSDLLDLLEREHECCAYDRPCHMYDLQRAIEGGWEYKGFHFEYMVPPSISGER